MGFPAAHKPGAPAKQASPAIKEMSAFFTALCPFPPAREPPLFRRQPQSHFSRMYLYESRLPYSAFDELRTIGGSGSAKQPKGEHQSTSESGAKVPQREHPGTRRMHEQNGADRRYHSP